MKNFTNPLENVRVASPCSQDWNAMIGDNRKRFCGECKLNVYNLSGMTQTEAERLLINSEGRLCVRFYRRSDGTVLTEDCPVGWKAIKQRISKTAAAVFSLILGVFGGIFVFGIFDRKETQRTMGKFVRENSNVATMGAVPVNIEPRQVMGNISVASEHQEGWKLGEKISRLSQQAK